MNRNVEHLLARINEENICQDFHQDLIIFDEEEKKDVEESIESYEYRLFKDIHSTSLSTKNKEADFHESKRSKYMLISKHKGNHVKIRKALKIPSSTFNRLRRESNEEHRHRYSKVRKGSIKMPLDLDKKKYREISAASDSSIHSERYLRNQLMVRLTRMFKRMKLEGFF